MFLRIKWIQTFEQQSCMIILDRQIIIKRQGYYEFMICQGLHIRNSYHFNLFEQSSKMQLSNNSHTGITLETQKKSKKKKSTKIWEEKRPSSLKLKGDQYQITNSVGAEQSCTNMDTVYKYMHMYMKKKLKKSGYKYIAHNPI